ncbi:MAG: hypothetical protein V7641_3622 [Blastocatellia bacterium]
MPQTRFEYIETAGSNTVTLVVEPDDKPDFLATLLSCGMPDRAKQVVMTIKSEAVVKRFGSQYDGYRVVYFGLVESDSDIRTGIPGIRSVLPDGRGINVIVWARAVFWRDAWAYFVNFYDANARQWRMLIVRQEMDKETKRTEIGHKLVDGMKLAFAQFEGFIKGVRKDDIPPEVFRKHLFNQIKSFAGEYSKLTKTNLAKHIDLDRDTVAKYLKRDPTLLDELQSVFMLHKKGKL